MNDKIFVDTNILVYSVANDSQKRIISDELLIKNDIVVSSQVINEFVSVTLRKKILPIEKIVEYSKQFMQVFNMVLITTKIIKSALNIMIKYKFSYWDSLILAAALESQCELLYSEDLQDGQCIDNRLEFSKKSF
ncbi:MAG: PIN domain-containing protein [Desulfamplus sp.]